MSKYVHVTLSMRGLLAKKLIGHVTGQFGKEFRIRKLLSSGGSRDVGSFLGGRFAFIAVVP